jgi:hypothetical protein
LPIDKAEESTETHFLSGEELHIDVEVRRNLVIGSDPEDMNSGREA